MRRHPMLIGLSLGMLWCGVGWSQTLAPSCEESVESQYRLLVNDKLVPEVVGAPWSQHLVSMAASIRQAQTLLDMEESQTKLGKKNIAQLYDQLQQAQKQLLVLQGQLQEAKSEVEKLKNGDRPPAN